MTAPLPRSPPPRTTAKRPPARYSGGRTGVSACFDEAAAQRETVRPHSGSDRLTRDGSLPRASAPKISADRTRHAAPASLWSNCPRNEAGGRGGWASPSPWATALSQASGGAPTSSPPNVAGTVRPHPWSGWLTRDGSRPRASAPKISADRTRHAARRPCGLTVPRMWSNCPRDVV